MALRGTSVDDDAGASGTAGARAEQPHVFGAEAAKGGDQAAAVLPVGCAPPADVAAVVGDEADAVGAAGAHDEKSYAPSTAAADGGDAAAAKPADDCEF